MHQLEVYYLNQAGRGHTHSGGSALIMQSRSTYKCAQNRQFFRQSLTVVPTPTVTRTNAVVRETLRTGGMILTVFAKNKSPEASPKNNVSKHVTELVQNIIGNLRGGGRRRTRGVTSVT